MLPRRRWAAPMATSSFCDTAGIWMADPSMWCDHYDHRDGKFHVRRADVNEHVNELPPLWVRDNCRCEGCVDPQSGQKLHVILDLASDSRVEQVDTHGDSVVVTVGPDGHRCLLPLSLLEVAGRAEVDPRSESAKVLWSGDDLSDAIPRARWDELTSSSPSRLEALSAVVRLGFVLVSGTPASEATVLGVARSFGFVRETNYGELFDVKVDAAPTNLAFSRRGLSPHTDNPYRDPVPTLQLLHCLQNAMEGGASGLVDGFAAAAALRREDPGAFDVLTHVGVPFAWRDAKASLRALRPLISTDPDGAVREIRFNNRSMQPIRQPIPVLEAFYRAYRRFAEIIMRPEMEVTFRMEPGDCLIFDNTRLLHSRTAFSDKGTGARHLQGCYADIDGLLSTIAVLGGEP